MAHPIQPCPTPTGEYQAHFGGPPGSTDLVAECKKWEKLCAELIADRQKVREELAELQAECELYRKSLFHLQCKDDRPNYDREIAFAHLGDKPSVAELIAELESAPEK